MVDQIDARVHADFARVRSRAFLKDLLAMFSGKRDSLLPYDRVKEKLHIGGPIYRGVRTVEVAKIVGSINRYRDFDRAFLPTTNRLADRWQAGWTYERKFNARLASAQRNSRRVLLCEPQTYMNSSGEAVGAVLAFYRVPVAGLLVVVDDADLPLGQLRLRASGGSGGHNGLRSIIEALGGTEEFARTSGGGASPRSVGAIRDSRESILWENQDLPASGDGSGGRERKLGGGILQAPGGARGNPLPTGRLCHKHWTSARLFCRLGPTLRSPRASLGVVARVRTPSGYAELWLKPGFPGGFLESLRHGLWAPLALASVTGALLECPEFDAIFIH
jgi:hypothetical protein